MSGKALLANLLASVGITAAAAATAGAVADGKPGQSAEDQTAGTQTLESLVEAAHEQGRLAGVTEGRKAERERFGTVLTDPGTDGKLGLAISLLSTTDLAADAIISNLKAAPSVAETVSAAEPGKQGQAKDPLTGAGGDAISSETPLVDTGQPGNGGDDLDEKEIAEMWGGAMAAVDPTGVAASGPWAGAFGNKEQRPN